MVSQVFGKYVLKRELARGEMARVVLATLRGAGGFERRLVVKQIRDELASDDEFVRPFVEEVGARRPLVFEERVEASAFLSGGALLTRRRATGRSSLFRAP